MQTSIHYIPNGAQYMSSFSKPLLKENTIFQSSKINYKNDNKSSTKRNNKNMSFWSSHFYSHNNLGLTKVLSSHVQSDRLGYLSIQPWTLNSNHNITMIIHSLDFFLLTLLIFITLLPILAIPLWTLCVVDLAVFCSYL